MTAARVRKPGPGLPKATKRPRVPIAESVRRAMTAEAAYYRAERRGFEPGYELDDWIAAEAEIERATAPHPGDEPSLCGD
jgi:hypothetical protein